MSPGQTCWVVSQGECYEGGGPVAVYLSLASAVRHCEALPDSERSDSGEFYWSLPGDCYAEISGLTVRE